VAAADPRVAAYADLLLDYSIAVQPGWQVLVVTTTEARPLAEELSAGLARRGAYALPRMTFGGRAPLDIAFISQRADTELAPLEQHVVDNCDAAVFVLAPSDPPRDEGLTVEQRRAWRSLFTAYRARGRANERPDVRCDFPTAWHARQAGLSLAEYEDVFYEACLRDWPAEGAKMQRVRERFDAAEEVRIESADTSLTFSLAGRVGSVDDGHANVPGGEVYYCPVEDSVNGTIAFDFPSGTVTDATLTLRDGVVADAHATAGLDELVAALDTDEGSRRFGEFGIGCNEGITRHLRNVLFDEKMAGTVHLALGDGFSFLGGQNRSAVHWDLVKDLRQDGRLYADGELVQSRGCWSIGRGGARRRARRLPAT
jgi:aminopeptidase